MNNAAPRPSVTNDKASTLRMLEGLDSASRPSFEPFDENQSGRWKVPATLAVLTIIAIAMWWWTQQHASEPASPPEASEHHVSTAAVAAAALGPAASRAVAATRASIAIEPRHDVARIESLPERVAAPTPSTMVEKKDTALERMLMPNEISSPRRIADAGQPPHPGRANTAKVAPATITHANVTPANSAVSKSTAAEQVTASPVAGKAESAVTALARPASGPGAGTKTRGAAALAPANPASETAGDADIALLGAMLRHMERDGPNDAAGAQAQLTIAQLVHRCDASIPQNEADSYECKRRICDGYWCKAEACPKPMALKRAGVLKALLQE